jgi:hypothetical protein
MASRYCEFCGKEWEFTTATIARNKKAAHMKTCKAYNNLSYIRHAVDKSKPQVAERLKELGDLARASHIAHMTETGEDDGYFSGDSVQYDFEESVPSALECNKLPINEDHLIFQLALLAKMDSISNKTLKIGQLEGPC